MDFYEVINNRRSIRKYSDRPLPIGALDRILHAAQLAPSWANRQCTHFVLVDDPSILQEFSENLKGNSCAGAFTVAPVTLVVCADPSDSGKMEGKDYFMADVACAMEHVMLAATAEGLATCWIGSFTQKSIKMLLDIPDDMQVVAMTPIGYAAEAPKPTQRVPMRERVFVNKWQKPIA